MKIKAYGKILLFGGYSILEPGGIGLVVNVNRGTTSEVTRTGSGKIVFDMKNFKINIETDKELFHLIKNPTLTFLKNAVQYCFEYLKSKDIKIKDIKLSTYNDPEFQIGKYKTGFGSSATSTVSAVAAILKEHDIDDINLVFKISRYAHYKSQGDLGSGYDISAACYGSQFFRAKNEEINDFLTYVNSENNDVPETFEMPQLNYLIAFCGKSSRTKDLIKKIKIFKSKYPEKYTDIMKNYNYANECAAKAFQKENLKDIIRTLELSWELRKKLGEASRAEIEPQKMSLILAEAKRNGALCAGLTGAGGGDNLFAICDDKEKLSEFLEDKGYYVISDVKVDSIGYESLD